MSIDAAPQSLPVLAIVGTVAIFSIVQSIFGVGLLVFGTPTLLLLDLPFNLVLGYLLPCSIVISALQLATSGGLTLEPIRRRFLVYTAPAVLAATIVTLAIGSLHQIRFAVGVMLLFTAVTRIGPMRTILERFVRAHGRPLLVGLGVIHGLSNLGGGILTAIVGSTFSDKAAIRRHVAFAYGTMASLQLAVVMLSAHPHLRWQLWLVLPALAAVTYLVLGQRAFRSTPQGPYQFGLTGLILSFGIILVGTG
jgi:hypothetical protein